MNYEEFILFAESNVYSLHRKMLYFLLAKDLLFLKFFMCGDRTCRIVSKLNVRPFHNVNSPLEAPVTRRLPSGVQAIQKIGHRILFVAVFTNLVVTALIGLST